MLTDRETEELGEAIDRIWEIGRGFGLDPFPTHFEVVPATIMYEFGAYGLPGRFSHWTHGKAFHQMKMMYDYGLSKIYELVINTNPCYGFLMENNSMVQNKLVVAHVMGHCDFFKNNVYFKHTSRQMIETASVNAERIRKYEYEHGERVVEEFLDAVLAIQEHIDPHLRTRHPSPEEIEAERRRRPPEGPYDDLWKLEERGKPPKEEERPRRRIPEEPEKDILGFLIQHAPELDDWQRDVISIVREEMLYFLPQMQTKIMNEGWACATGDALLATSRGFIRFRDLYEQEMRITIGSGEPGALHPITAFHKEEGVPTLRITTRRGYTLEGALKHRVRLADGSWAFLRDLRQGDRVALARGIEVWAAEEVPIEYQPETPGTIGGPQARPPATLNAPLAYLLGYFTGAGTVTESGVSFTCDDEAHARYLGDLVETALGVPAPVREDGAPTRKRWCIELSSREVARLFETLGAGAGARDVPDAILRSPRHIVSAFLRGCFDASGCPGAEGVTLSTRSDELVQCAQILLLNYGILSARSVQADGSARLEITGSSAALFRDAIGHELPCKRAALDAYLEGCSGSQQEEATDEIVAIEPGNADVFDITVDVAHAYVANGLINHNSFWHGRIMRELDLTDDEFIEYSQLNAGVLSPSPSRRQINPYYVGVKIWEDILRRWDSPTEEERKLFGREPGKGMEKLFEVRELDNDVSFLRNYLTEELVEELDLYVYELRDDEWVITDKDWEKTRDMLVASMTNMGYPVIEVHDGDYRRNRELYLVHAYEGRELDIAYAEKALQHVYTLWGRPVHLETVVDGEPVLLTYDGHDNITRVLN